MGFNLDDYVDVAERLNEFRTRYPTGRIITTLLEVPAPFADKFVAVRAEVWRDQTPSERPDGTGIAWEPVPGKTPYTKDSELMNAETSAVGRALVNALVADTKRGIASRQEVAGRTKTSAGASVKGKGAPPAETSGSGNPPPPEKGGGEAGTPPPTPRKGYEFSVSTCPGHGDWTPAPRKGFVVCGKCGHAEKAA